MRSKKPTVGSQYIAGFPSAQISFDTNAFDEAIRSQGITLVHWRAMRNPTGMTDKYDIRRPNETIIQDGFDISNGFIYEKAGEVTVLFTANSAQVNTHEPVGLMDPSSVSVTFPRCYDNSNERVMAVPFDRFFLKDCESQVVTWEVVTASGTGIDRLQYPAVFVESVIDSHLKKRFLGEDFDIVDGNIKWRPGKGIDMNVDIGKPGVYTIRYRYQAHWYLKQLIHEIRVAQVTDPMTYDRIVERMPYSAILSREYVFLADRRSENSNDPRDARVPSSGGTLGSR